MVTFELAVGLLVTALLTALFVWVVGLQTLRSQCDDSAAQVARLLARGDTESANAALKTKPSDANISIGHTADAVTVTCRIEKSYGKLGPFVLSAEHTSPLEVGVER